MPPLKKKGNKPATKQGQNPTTSSAVSTCYSIGQPRKFLIAAASHYCPGQPPLQPRHRHATMTRSVTAYCEALSCCRPSLAQKRYTSSPPKFHLFPPLSLPQTTVAISSPSARCYTNTTADAALVSAFVARQINPACHNPQVQVYLLSFILLFFLLLFFLMVDDD